MDNNTTSINNLNTVLKETNKIEATNIKNDKTIALAISTINTAVNDLVGEDFTYTAADNHSKKLSKDTTPEEIVNIIIPQIFKQTKEETRKDADTSKQLLVSTLILATQKLKALDNQTEELKTKETQVTGAELNTLKSSILLSEKSEDYQSNLTNEKLGSIRYWSQLKLVPNYMKSLKQLIVDLNIPDINQESLQLDSDEFTSETQEGIKKIQEYLENKGVSHISLGYRKGNRDGLPGPQTLAAIQTYLLSKDELPKLSEEKNILPPHIPPANNTIAPYSPLQNKFPDSAVKNPGKEKISVLLPDGDPSSVSPFTKEDLKSIDTNIIQAIHQDIKDNLSQELKLYPPKFPQNKNSERYQKLYDNIIGQAFYTGSAHHSSASLNYYLQTTNNKTTNHFTTIDQFSLAEVLKSENNQLIVDYEVLSHKIISYIIEKIDQKQALEDKIKQKQEQQEQQALRWKKFQKMKQYVQQKRFSISDIYGKKEAEKIINNPGNYHIKSFFNSFKEKKTEFDTGNLGGGITYNNNNNLMYLELDPLGDNKKYGYKKLVINFSQLIDNNLVINKQKTIEVLQQAIKNIIDSQK